MKKKVGILTCERCGFPKRLSLEMLRQRMHEKGLNASKLAQLVGTNRHTISRLLNEEWAVEDMKYGLALKIIEALYG